MWFVYESTIVPSAVLGADRFPVPPFCDPTTATTYRGFNGYQQRVKYLAAKIDCAKIDEMPDHIREDYERAARENRAVNNVLITPRKLR